MKDYKKYINALRKCAKEHEDDSTFTGHIIVVDLCRDTANLLEKLEQEHILDKIKSIVAEWKTDTWTDNFSYECMIKIAEIIDKAESEDKE